METVGELKAFPLMAWPRCRAVGNRGRSGVMVDNALTLAVRCESAAAIEHCEV